MRILTCLHTMEIGGSQINAIEIAAKVAALGHEVLIYGPPGELCPMVAGLGLEFVAAPPKGEAPSPRNVAAIADVVREREIDLVHAYEWAPSLEAAYGAYLRSGVPLVVTVLSMEVPAWVPKHLPLVVGTEEIAEQERGLRSQVYVIEPPIDTDLNAPVADNRAARARFGLADDDVAVVSVSRLNAHLKLEGLLAAIRAAGGLDPALRVRLLIVGDGPARGELQAAADAANASAGAERVTLVGEMLDPTDAYTAADLVIGMGSSALRAMAFAKPLLVQGERGFWMPFNPGTLPTFLHQGFYGLGDGKDGTERVAAGLTSMIMNRVDWPGLGDYGRQVVIERFSLAAAGRRQVEIYEAAMKDRLSLAQRVSSLAHPTAHLINFKKHLATERIKGRRS
ncbi:glycosyltransferase involved in cell wall biosynthesis [Actinoplanes lutulentus]|uniref:Glycosyltransferase involved in cell wall biosynthesis n=1 Tax=Actinoplanes lutulentus TaxID=1287878 RepID=A0A327YWL8_9ACTN|nr:glycosyltransferase [Actinoplanes lutulentus]MBB2940423.1 glycosyltransferase involved in cell wall biosynthesis [Actinoplanes lutulentus]RAK25844.1 glycosyltransferase involved in cell wall biosynthesis [Actinoplanes lutulentus]